MPISQDLKRVKWQYWVGGIGGAGIVYYLYKRRKTATATSATDTGATDPNIDPSTGIPYSQESGYSPVSGTSPSLYSYYDPATGALINAGIGSQATGPTTPGTALAWVQQATAYLVAQGWDALLVSTALGKYIAGRPLTPQEQDVVDAARAAEGQVPGGAPPVQQTPPPGQTQRLSSPTHLTVRRTGAGSFLFWTAVPHAESYTLTYNGIPIPESATPGTSAVLRRHGLHSVIANAPGFKSSLPSAPIIW
jgi:hypothetical protein